MKYIDTHLHLKSNLDKSLLDRFENLNNQLKAEQIEHAVLIHMFNEDISLEDYSSHVHKYE